MAAQPNLLPKTLPNSHMESISFYKEISTSYFSKSVEILVNIYTTLKTVIVASAQNMLAVEKSAQAWASAKKDDKNKRIVANAALAMISLRKEIGV